MEFLEREPHKNEEHPKYKLPLRNRLIEDESSKKFFDDMERIHDEQEARDYKEQARTALNKRTLARTAEFNDTMDRWLEENKLRSAMQQGIWKPEKKEAPLCPKKIGITAAWQGTSLVFAILCIISGVWPIAVLSLPVMFAFNLMWLLDREGK